MNPINITIYSDLICPWCYIGQRRLRDGLKLLGTSANEVDIHWKAFQLNPAMPVEGLNRKRYRSAKFGSWARSQAMDAQVVSVGKSLGLSFSYDKIHITPNTFKGHRLIWWSRRFGKQDQMAVALLEAYFSNGLDVGNSKILAEIAATIGISGEAAATFLASEEGMKEVMEEEKEARLGGVNGVPFFVINGQPAFSGAQSPEQFFQAITTATQTVEKCGLDSCSVGSDYIINESRYLNSR